MLAGRPTAEAAGLSIPMRSALFDRLREMDEGALFQLRDIAQDRAECDALAAMRDFDYVHVAEGYFTPIIETRHLRRLPDERRVIASWAKLKNLQLVETGDRTAYSIGARQWYPLEGWRFHSSGKDEVLSLGNMKIRLYASPDWAREETPRGTLLRCLCDQSTKEAARTLRWIAQNAPDLNAAQDQLPSWFEDIGEQKSATAPHGPKRALHDIETLMLAQQETSVDES